MDPVLGRSRPRDLLLLRWRSRIRYPARDRVGEDPRGRSSGLLRVLVHHDIRCYMAYSPVAVSRRGTSRRYTLAHTESLLTRTDIPSPMPRQRQCLGRGGLVDRKWLVCTAAADDLRSLERKDVVYLWRSQRALDHCRLGALP